MINKAKNIYLVGIKGVGMTALAVILKKMGKKVWGSDVEQTFPTDEILKKYALKAIVGFKKQNISQGIDLVVTTGAHGGLENIEALEAKKKGIQVLTLAEAIGLLMKGYRNKISICGSHGKTTTTALTAFVLKKLGCQPTYSVGTPKFSGYPGADLGKKDYFVVEADEYVSSPFSDMTPRFIYQNPDYILATNIDFDHPDVYKNLEEIKKVFLRFFEKVKKVGPNSANENLLGSEDKANFVGVGKPVRNKMLIACYDDKNLQDVVKKITKDKVVTYGFSNKADLHLNDVKTTAAGMDFKAFFKKRKIGDFSLAIFGRQNVLNAGGAILLFKLLNLDLRKIANAMKKFKGAKRRFEKISQVDNIYLFDDYGHHPAEIEATISAARLRFSSRRIVVIFQPHTFSRTEALKKEFADSLALADLSIVVDIFPSGRERREDFKISSREIEDEAKKMGKRNVLYLPEPQLVEYIKNNLTNGDILITMGAGDIYRRHFDIIRALKSSYE